MQCICISTDLKRTAHKWAHLKIYEHIFSSLHFVRMLMRFSDYHLFGWCSGHILFPSNLFYYAICNVSGMINHCTFLRAQMVNVTPTVGIRYIRRIRKISQIFYSTCNKFSIIVISSILLILKLTKILFLFSKRSVLNFDQVNQH